MPNVKVRVKFEFKHEGLAQILPLGYETTLEPILSTEPKVIVRDWYTRATWNKETQTIEKGVLLAPKVVAPIGSYEGYRFIGANGFIYTDKLLGFMTAERVFNKILT